jgi:hypothetical protein
MAQVDVSAFRINPDGSVTQVLADETSTGESVQGPKKLAQRVVMELMTIKGSIQYMVNRGTKFLNYLATGNAANDRDVFVAFAAARVDVMTNIVNEDNQASPPLPPDEKLQDIKLLQVAVTEDNVLLQIAVTSKAGTITTVVMPLEFPV